MQYHVAPILQLGLSGVPPPPQSMTGHASAGMQLLARRGFAHVVVRVELSDLVVHSSSIGFEHRAPHLINITIRARWMAVEMTKVVVDDRCRMPMHDTNWQCPCARPLPPWHWDKPPARPGSEALLNSSSN